MTQLTRRREHFTPPEQGCLGPGVYLFPLLFPPQKARATGCAPIRIRKGASGQKGSEGAREKATPEERKRPTPRLRETPRRSWQGCGGNWAMSMASSGPPRTLKAEAEAQGAKPKFRSAASCPSMYPSSGRSASPPKKETPRSFTNFPGLGEKSQVDKLANLKEKKEAIPGIYGTTLPISTFSHQESHVYGLETDCSPEKKFHSPEGTLTSTFYKDHYKVAIEQLTTFNMSKNSRIAQLNSNSNKQGQFHSWNHVSNQGNTSVGRDFSKPDEELPSGSSDGLINVGTPNPAAHSFTKRYHPVSYPETKKTALEKNCRKDDGDCLKKTNEVTTSDSYLATDSSSDDIHSASKWKSRKRNVNTENKHLVEEKEVTESEKRNITLLKYFRDLNLNIKTDPFAYQEDAPSLLENDRYPYPDFLPSPYNNLDLKKLSLSKSDSWKSSINPPLNDSLDKIVSRLVEMERLQHLTISREKKREAVPSVAATSSRSIPTKELHQSKPPRPLDCLCCLFRPEKDAIKCTCPHCHGHKNSATSIRSASKPS